MCRIRLLASGGAREWKNLAFLLLASFLSSACASAPKPSDAELRLAESLRLVKEQVEKRKAISGTGSISWISRAKNMAAPGLVLVEWPDRFRLEVQDPLGGLLALLVLNQDRFWWYSSDQKEILTGPIEKMGGSISLAFSAQDLVRAFLARPDLDRWLGGQWKSAGVIESSDRRETLAWSDRLNEPIEWARELSGHRVVIHFEDYVSRFGASFPGKLRLESLSEKERDHTISWVWREWQPTLSNPKKLFQIPQEQLFGRKIKTLP